MSDYAYENTRRVSYEGGAGMITVCDKCRRACCWQGYFMCDKARCAGTLSLPVAVLLVEDREHPDWWLTDEELAAGFDGMHQPPYA